MWTIYIILKKLSCSAGNLVSRNKEVVFPDSSNAKIFTFKFSIWQVYHLNAAWSKASVNVQQTPLLSACGLCFGSSAYIIKLQEFFLEKHK